MGVLNITPDSFSDGGMLLNSNGIDMPSVVARAEAMLAAGACVLDVGGESTRPGAEPVSIDVELGRVIPVVEALGVLDTIISVDTRHTTVAAAAIAAGAHVVNDVSAGDDEGMLSLIADTGVGFAMMHMQGLPSTMQRAPTYAGVVVEVGEFLQARYQSCKMAGIEAERLMLDPGFGFGKTLQHNLELLRNLETLRVDDAPLLVGLSRKSMLGAITGRAATERVHASVAAALLCAQHGADLIRVHDVAATADALKVLQAVQDTEIAMASLS